MIKSTFGLTKDPFYRNHFSLLPQQSEALEMIRIHAAHGGFSVIVGNPGVGKTVLRYHLEKLGKERDCLTISFTQTMHTYPQILQQLAHTLQLESSAKLLEKDIIHTVFKNASAQKNLYTVIDEAHLLDIDVLKKLRLLFDRFPAKHNLVLLGHPELLIRLSMRHNEDLKSRISYSKQLLPLNDQDLTQFIHEELSHAGLAANTFDDAAIALILRAVQGNLRLTRNLCYASLVLACIDNERVVTTRHVSQALIQPHWRSHEALVKQETPSNVESKPSTS